MVSLIIALSTATVVRFLSYAKPVFILWFFLLCSKLGTLFHGRASNFRTQAYRYAAQLSKDISSNITEPLL